MVNIIRDQDIIFLIEQYTETKERSIVVINPKGFSLLNRLHDLSYKVIREEVKSELTLSIYINSLYRFSEEVSMFIFYDIGGFTYDRLQLLASILFNKDIKYIILTKKHKKETKNMRAFLKFYEPYRTLGNVLLLRRF